MTAMTVIRPRLASSPVGNRVFREGHVPTDASFPYVSVIDPISDAPALSGDSRTLGRRRLLQLDVWELAAEEEDDLADDLGALLDGHRSGAYRFRTLDVTRVPDGALAGPEAEAGPDGITHHAITVSYTRTTT